MQLTESKLKTKEDLQSLPIPDVLALLETSPDGIGTDVAIESAGITLVKGDLGVL